METMFTEGLLIVIAALVSGGIGINLEQRRQAVHSLRTAQKRTEEQDLYFKRVELVHRWQSVLMHFRQYLAEATDLEQMARGFAKAICQEYPGSSVFLALGPQREIMLLPTMPNRQRGSHLSQNSFIMSRPRLDDPLAQQLAEMLYVAAVSRDPKAKRWWLLREINPLLQEQLPVRFQMHGEGLLVPLRVGASMYGVALIVNPVIEYDVSAARDNGEFAMILTDMVAIWIRYMAPNMAAGSKAFPEPSLVETLLAFDSLQAAADGAPNSSANSSMMEEVASIATSVSSGTLGVASLVEQTCGSLLRICQGDICLALSPRDQGEQHAFAVEAMQIAEWTWTSLRSWQGSGERSPAWASDIFQGIEGDPFVRLASEGKQVIHALTLEEVQNASPHLAEHHQRSLLIIPVWLEYRCQAIFVVGRKAAGGFAEPFRAWASAAIALHTLSLQTLQYAKERNEASQATEQAYKTASSTVAQTLNVLAHLSRLHGKLTARLPQSVATLAEQIARQMHLPSTDVHYIRIAATICDIGMIAVPSIAWLQKDSSAQEDLQQLHAHPQISVDIVKEMSIFQEALPIILHHHEQWDGSGYPAHLKGPAIPCGARILAVAEAFIGLQTPHSSRNAPSPEQAFKQIQQAAGVQFDPEVVRALAQIIASNQVELPRFDGEYNIRRQAA